MNTDFRTAKTKLAYARKLMAELAATESATEAEQLGQHIALLIGEAAQSKAEGLRRVERFARNFTELMPELIGEKAGIVSIPDSFWKPYDDHKQEQAKQA